MTNKTNNCCELKDDYFCELDFIFDATGIAVFVEDENRKLKFVNKFFCEFFKINTPAQQLTNFSIAENISLLSQVFFDSFQFENLFFELSKSKELSTGKVLQLKDGSAIIQNYFPSYKGNTFKGHIWVYREHQNYYRTPKYHFLKDSIIETALNSIPNEIAILNDQLQFIYTNKAYIKNDEKRTWAKGKTLKQYYSYVNLNQETAINRESIYKKVVDEKQPESWQEVNQKDNIFYQRSVYPIFDNKGDLTSLIEYATNISSQKKLELQLEQAIDHFYNVVNSVNDIVLQTDGKLNIKYVNDYWQNVTGQNNRELAAKSIFEILEITNYELYQKTFSILNGQSKQQTGILSIADKNKNSKHYKYTLQNGFDINTGKGGILATLSDVTSPKMQESHLIELIKKEKELNELKTTFVNMVSHELRTPLTVISSSAEILDLMVQSGKSHEQVSIYTKQIIDEVEKMTAFMQDLLMISKIEVGKISINLLPSNIVDFTRDIISKHFSPWKDGRTVEFSYRRTPKNVNIDSSLLEHSLQNILVNAFKYSVAKPNPKIRVGFSKTYFTISVVDNGIGIPADENSKLFTSFFRASNTKQIAGTGIGLMVTKYFTEQHKGAVLYKSVQNRGSIFTLKIPYTND